jgi:hypothetical protein
MSTVQLLLPGTTKVGSMIHTSDSNALIAGCTLLFLAQPFSKQPRCLYIPYIAFLPFHKQGASNLRCDLFLNGHKGLKTTVSGTCDMQGSA